VKTEATQVARRDPDPAWRHRRAGEVEAAKREHDVDTERPRTKRTATGSTKKPRQPMKAARALAF